jgi:geranylgeranyl diphosphate synthase type I
MLGFEVDAMIINDSISSKLKATAVQVDKFIDELLKPRKPKVLYEAARHIIAAGGKRLRPYLVLKSCELVGGDPDDAMPFAAALELLHNFTLIHDDIMDNDSLRRGVPTVHACWGVPIGIVSGDFLFAKVYDAMVKPYVVGELPCERVMACIKRVTKSTIAICEGQVLDISFPNTSEVSEEDYISMAGDKTSTLFRACAEVGAILGGSDPDEMARIGSFAWNAGIAFQIVDDTLGAISNEENLGKPVGSDLREGKKTLIIIHALEHASPDERVAIERVLGSKDASAPDIETAEKALVNTGSIRYAQEKARYYAMKSKEMLAAFPDSVAKKDLLELVDYFTERTY